MLTAHGTVESAVEAMKEGAFDFLQKPVESPAALRLLVNRAVERHRLSAAKEAAGATGEPPLSYGAAAMQPVERALRKVAATDATVLLLGESGSGKEVAARALHRWSGRAAGPFVAINCAALSENLLESELFGHEKGAFTGAHARQRGRIELAEGGTFFLDEVGELAPGLQAKLLRVLQEKRFERVGGRQTVEANVRWVAATNRDLPAMIRAGTLPRGSVPPAGGVPGAHAAAARAARGHRPAGRHAAGAHLRLAGPPAAAAGGRRPRGAAGGGLAGERARAGQRARAQRHPGRRRGDRRRRSEPAGGGAAGRRARHVWDRRRGHHGGHRAAGDRTRPGGDGREPAARGRRCWGSGCARCTRS